MKKGPVTKGTIKTSQQPLTRATPQRPSSQGSQLVGGFPVNMGVGGGRRKAPTRAAAQPMPRRKMY